MTPSSTLSFLFSATILALAVTLTSSAESLHPSSLNSTATNSTLGKNETLLQVPSLNSTQFLVGDEVKILGDILAPSNTTAPRQGRTFGKKKEESSAPAAAPYPMPYPMPMPYAAPPCYPPYYGRRR